MTDREIQYRHLIDLIERINQWFTNPLHDTDWYAGMMNLVVAVADDLKATTKEMLRAVSVAEHCLAQMMTDLLECRIRQHSTPELLALRDVPSDERIDEDFPHYDQWVELVLQRK